jgi:hypothetical protein
MHWLTCCLPGRRVTGWGRRRGHGLGGAVWVSWGGRGRRTEPAGSGRTGVRAEARKKARAAGGLAGGRHGDWPAGLGPDGAARVGLGEAPPAGAGGHHRESPAAFGRQVESARRRDVIGAFIGDRDPGHAVARAIDFDNEHAAVPGGGMRDRVGAQLRDARHERFPGRAARQQFGHEPARLWHRGGRTAECASPRPLVWHQSDGTGRSRGTQRKHRVGTAHRRSPPDK